MYTNIVVDIKKRKRKDTLLTDNKKSQILFKIIINAFYMA